MGVTWTPVTVGSGGQLFNEIACIDGRRLKCAMSQNVSSWNPLPGRCLPADVSQAEPPAALRSALGVPAGPAWEAAGCPQCLGGYRGRTGLFELLSADEAVREGIRAGSGSAALRDAARRSGMRTLLEDGLDKAARGVTSLEEVLRAVGRPAAAT